MLIASQNDDGSETSNNRAPTLCRDNVREHSSSFPDFCSMRGDTSCNGIVTTDAYPKQDTEYGEIYETVVWTDLTGWRSHAENRSEDDEHEFFAINRSSAKCVGSISKCKLADDAPDIGRGFEETL